MAFSFYLLLFEWYDGRIRMLEWDKMREMMKILLDSPFSRSLPMRLSNLYIEKIKIRIIDYFNKEIAFEIKEMNYINIIFDNI